jgi:hypothetical protein
MMTLSDMMNTGVGFVVCVAMGSIVPESVVESLE